MAFIYEHQQFIHGLQPIMETEDNLHHLPADQMFKFMTDLVQDSPPHSGVAHENKEGPPTSERSTPSTPPREPIIQEKRIREIELKITHIRLSEFQRALEILKLMSQKDQAINQGTVVQKDYYLDHAGLQGTQYALYNKGEHSKIFRVRQENKLKESEGDTGNHSICVKVSRKGQVQDDHERHEYETQVSNPQGILELFKVLGFSTVKIVCKERSTFLYNEYQVFLDKVVGFGKTGSSYQKEFFSYIIEIELKDNASEIPDIPFCLGQMKKFVEDVLKITKYHQDQHGMENYIEN